MSMTKKKKGLYTWLNLEKEWNVVVEAGFWMKKDMSVVLGTNGPVVKNSQIPRRRLVLDTHFSKTPLAVPDKNLRFRYLIN